MRASCRRAKVYAKERRRSSGSRHEPRVSDWSRMRNVRLGLNIPSAGSRPFDVAGFGLNSIDLLAVVAEYPASNTKQRLQRFMHLPGGQIATALTVCARLG